MPKKKDTPPAGDTLVSKRVQQYILIRDQLKMIDEEYEKKRAPFIELQNLLTGWMQDFLEKTGADSVKTAHGTCYSSTRYTASISDGSSFMDFVIANGQFDLLDRRANSTAVRTYVEENGRLPPGVNLSAIRTVGVRRKSGSKTQENDE